MRIGTICKSLNVLPRAGGVLDQPANEMLHLEAILNAFAQAESLESDVADKKDQAKMRLKERGV